MYSHLPSQIRKGTLECYFIYYKRLIKTEKFLETTYPNTFYLHTKLKIVIYIFLIFKLDYTATLFSVF